MTVAATWVGSLHKAKGRQGYRPEAVVIHIMEGTLAGTDRWFNDPESGVSAHYGVGRDGAVHQYVGETDTAFHAGRRSKPAWKLIKPDSNPNLYTIGIEHEGHADTPWTEAMYRASASLASEICNRWAIPIDRDHIVCHREIYTRKSCPGHAVEMDKLVQMIRAASLDPGAYNFVRREGTVRTRVGLNVRRAAPTTAAPVARTVVAGAQLAFDGWTSNGAAVNGNAHWYRDSAGNYFWAGGTERPVPGREA